MRLVAGGLALVLASSLALADDAPAPAPIAEPATVEPAPVAAKVKVRVVRVLRETRQALLYDRSAGGTYLLVSVGEKVGPYTVQAIEDDEVTLSLGDRQVVLAAPDRSWRRRREEREPAPAPVAAAPATPADPYAAVPAPSPAVDAPADPYAEPQLREVTAPSVAPVAVPAVPAVPAVIVQGVPAPSTPADPYAPIAVSPAPSAPAAPSTIGPAPAAPGPALAAPTTPADPYAGLPALVPPSTPADPYTGPAPVVAPAPNTPADPYTAAPPSDGAAPAPAFTPSGDPILSRREVDAALNNFGALAVAFRASFTPAGIRVDALLDGSLFAKAGLRPGDVITAVDGRPLRSLDDVAGLYARAGALRALSAQVLRGGKLVTLHVAIQ